MTFKSDLSSTDVSIGFSDRIILSVSIVGFTALVYIVHSLMGFGSTKNSSSSSCDDDGLTDDERLARADVNTLNRAQRRARAKAIMKLQRRAPSAAIPVDGARHGENRLDIVALEVDENLDRDNGDTHVPVPSRKERQQNAKLAEKEERHLFQEERERHQKEAQEVAQRLKKQRLLETAKRLEEEQNQKEVERLSREEEERNLWSTFITPSKASHKSVKTVSEFIEDCKQDRRIDIQILATEYGVVPLRVVDRIEQLLSDGRIAGFFQDSQKRFIFVSDEELFSISSIVREHGSISLEQFTTVCQQTIGM
jgi:hypothetical protein